MDWRKAFGATGNITKKDIETGEDFKPYKSKGKKTELPNKAKFTGDKWPSEGDSAQIELETWKKQNNQFNKNKKRDEKDTSRGSAILTEDKAETLTDHLEEKNTAAPGIDSKKIKHDSSWRQVLADVSVKKKPDGTVEVNVDEGFNQSPQQSVAPQQAPSVEEPSVEEDQSQEKVASKVKAWEIKKEGNLSLIGKECDTHAGIFIMDGDKEVELYKVAKEGHTWEELIPKGKWETIFDERVRSASK